MFSAALCYHPDDAALALRLESYLTLNLDLLLDHIPVGAEVSLVDALESGFSRQSVLGFLSPASWPRPLPRDQWEPLLHDAVEQDVRLGWALAGQCGFPALLRRSSFFDLSSGDLCFRAIRRWMSSGSLFPALDGEMDELFSLVGDAPGACDCSTPQLASRFVDAVAPDFDFVLRIDANGRTPVSLAAEVCSGLGMFVSYPLAESTSRIQDALRRRRGLLVVENGHLGPLLPSAPRASILSLCGAPIPSADPRQLTKQLEDCIRGRACAPAPAVLDRAVTTALAGVPDTGLLRAAVAFFRAEYRVAEAEDLLRRLPSSLRSQFTGEDLWVADAWGYEKPPVTAEGQLALF